MPIRELLTLPMDELRSSSGILRTPADDVTEFDAELQDLIKDLLDTLHSHKIAVGLAAPQIDVPRKVAVINLKNDNESDLVIINAKIIREFGSKDKKLESCMSIPNYRGPVVRRKKIVVEYYDKNGNRNEIEASGFRARAISHEIDHLRGILYTDHVAALDLLETVDFFKQDD